MPPDLEPLYLENYIQLSANTIHTLVSQSTCLLHSQLSTVWTASGAMRL